MMRFFEHYFLTYCAKYVGWWLAVLSCVYVDSYIIPLYAGISEQGYYVARWLNVNTDWKAYLQKNSVWAKELSYLKPSEWVVLQLEWYFFQSDYPDLVVAHYHEDLSWLESYYPLLGHIYLYCKDKDACTHGLSERIPDEQITIRYLPNVGREGHTYLYHMIHNYGNFSRRTIFTMASLHGNFLRYYSFLASLLDKNPRFHVLQKGSTAKLAGFSMSEWTQGVSLGDGYDYKKSGLIMLTHPRPLGAWTKKHMHFDVSSYTGRYGRSKHGAIFSVTAENLQSHSITEFEDLLFLHAISDSIEAGYYMERVWRFYLQDLP
ncbi:MAG: DUF3431 domain-containing protein [Pseudomonadota bacterium]|nr:DUF3431 domain-containing protein [Pseudomonadota bacterium]